MSRPVDVNLPRRRAVQFALGAGSALAFSFPAAGAAANVMESIAVRPGQRPAGDIRRLEGSPVLSLGHFDLGAEGYGAEEYLVEGRAAIFAVDGAQGPDGHWPVRPGRALPYRLRFVVVRPSVPARFSGTAVVEWNNVSAGGDAAPGWITMHREAIRAGHAWVAVSVQKVGIDGGNGLALGVPPLKKADYQRYAGLDHPGDSYAFDIFAQAGHAIRDNAVQLFGAPLARLIAFGASQSAWFLTSYINAIAPLDAAYDGYFLQARFSGAAPLENPDIFQETTLPGSRIRTDLPYPVLIVESETDIVGKGISQGGYAHARQPAHDRLRVWEIAGASHADLSIFAVANADTDALTPAKRERLWRPGRNLLGAMLDVPVNSAPQQYYMMNAALRTMTSWVAGGAAPPQGEIIATTTADPEKGLMVERDPLGIAKGGVRSPWVDVPLMIHSGAPNLAHPMGILIGQSSPIPFDRIAHLYPGGSADYQNQFAASLDRAIAKGFLLAENRDELIRLGREAWTWASPPLPDAKDIDRPQR